LKNSNALRDLGEMLSRMLEKIHAVLEVMAPHKDYKG